MFIRAYLRASTQEQNASRAKETLKAFVSNFDKRIASFYIENRSGNSLNRPELLRLLDESEKNDVLLVESIDRLTRLNRDDWEVLDAAIRDKGVNVVSIDLPTSHMSFDTKYSDDFMSSILSAINRMMMDILAASSYKEYKERERKQRDGIELAKLQGKYKGRRPNLAVHERVKAISESSANYSLNDIAKLAGCSRSTVIRVQNKQKKASS